MAFWGLSGLVYEFSAVFGTLVVAPEISSASSASLVSTHEMDRIAANIRR